MGNYVCNNNNGEMALINRNSEYYTNAREKNISDGNIEMMENELELCKQRIEVLPEIIKWLKILTLSLYGLCITGILIGPTIFGASQVATQLMTAMLPLYLGVGVTFGAMALIKYKSLKQEVVVLERKIKLLEAKISEQKSKLQSLCCDQSLSNTNVKDESRKQILFDLRNLLLAASLYENNKRKYQKYYKNNHLWEQLSGKYDENCIEAIEDYITKDLSKHKTRGGK